jgi:hypothetical protein
MSQQRLQRLRRLLTYAEVSAQNVVDGRNEIVAITDRQAAALPPHFSEALTVL